jgi:hypothetical protein
MLLFYEFIKTAAPKARKTKRWGGAAAKKKSVKAIAPTLRMAIVPGVGNAPTLMRGQTDIQHCCTLLYLGAFPDEKPATLAGGWVNLSYLLRNMSTLRPSRVTTV